MPHYDEMNVCLVALYAELYGECKILADFLFCRDIDLRHIRGSGLICDADICLVAVFDWNYESF